MKRYVNNDVTSTLMYGGYALSIALLVSVEEKYYGQQRLDRRQRYQKVSFSLREVYDA